MKPILFSTPMIKAILEGRKTQTRRIIKNPEKMESFKTKYEVGDVLWVRETFCIEGNTTKYFIYKADITETMWNRFNWKPSIFMPKEACRIKLKITDIKVQRLQDINGFDAIAEGIEEENIKYSKLIAMRKFMSLWDSLNEKRGYGWITNPFVWVITFEKLK